MPFLCLFDRCGKNRLTESVAGGVNLFFPNELRSSEHNPRGAGGALLDVGIYGINFALMHFGRDIERIESSVKMLDTGVDEMENITFSYKDGKTAMKSAGITARSDRQGIFYGTKGYMVVDNINNPLNICVYTRSSK